MTTQKKSDVVIMSMFTDQIGQHFRSYYQLINHVIKLKFQRKEEQPSYERNKKFASNKITTVF